METTSSLKMKFAMVKSVLFSFTNRQKERDYKIIEDLAFKSTCEQDIFTTLKTKHWQINIALGIASITLNIIQLMIAL